MMIIYSNYFVEVHQVLHCIRSSHRRCSGRKGLFRNSVTRIRLCQSLGLATLLKRRLWYRCFPGNFAKFLRTPFSQSTSGRLLLKIKLLSFIILKRLLQSVFQIVNMKYQKQPFGGVLQKSCS